LLSGSVKKAINIRDKEEQYAKINEIYNNLGNNMLVGATSSRPHKNIDIIDLMTSKEQIFKDKTQIDDILSYINLLFFDKVRLNAKYIECMKSVEDTKDRLKKNNNYDMTIDNLIMTVWEAING